MSVDWVVQLEMRRENDAALDDVFYERLVQCLVDCTPRLLYSFDRYALLLCVTARTPLEAHLLALTRWEDAVRDLAAPKWAPVRAEVVTEEEFERECLLAEENERLLGELERQPSRTGADDLIREVFEDAATHLPTAAAFRSYVQQALTRRQHPSRLHAILFVDLQPPDALPGTDHRDLLLLAVERLAAVTRPADVLARVGPSALALLVQNVPDEEAPTVLARRAVEALAGTAGVTVGIALSRASSSDADRLLAAAFDAAAVARRAGGGHWAVFRPSPRPPVEWSSELSSEIGCDGSPDE